MPHEYLLVTLSGPLSAWGEIAVGERRSSWPRPSKSAVLGLVAAALGYDRNDTAAHTALNDGLHFAVRVDSPVRSFGGNAKADSRLMPLRDFHTAEFPPQVLVKEAEREVSRAPTRADHLRAIKANRERRVNPVLSERWYWIDMRATVALWPSGACAAPALSEIEAALHEPVFALYLGRKSCPLGRPLNPERVPASNLKEAFCTYSNRDAAAAAKALPAKNRLICTMVFQALAAKPGGEIWAEAVAVPQDQRKETQSRRDAIRDRRSWTFSDRKEARIDANAGGNDVSLPR
jgi:CRISPR system Cascade subunit CasD